MNQTIDIHARTLLALITCAPFLVACGTTTRLDHAANVPESGQRVHQAPVDGQLGSSELEEPDPQADVVQGEAPGYPQVMASWSDPVGDPRTWRDSAIGLHPGIMDACGIDDRYAYFAFDSSGLSELAKKTLADLATCLVSGPLAGQGIVLVGHTDPRGSDKHNEELGKSRAQVVSDYLTTRGLTQGKQTVLTAGEKEARENPIKWPADRRVDIRLAD